MRWRWRLPVLRALFCVLFECIAVSGIAAHKTTFVWQRHAKRLARSGQIKEIAGAFLRPRRELTFEESMQTYEVGACVFCECSVHAYSVATSQIHLLPTPGPGRNPAAGSAY